MCLTKNSFLKGMFNYACWRDVALFKKQVECSLEELCVEVSSCLPVKGTKASLEKGEAIMTSVLGLALARGEFSLESFEEVFYEEKLI